MALDSKLRGCDLAKLRVRDIAHGEAISKRAMVLQQKTNRSVQFEITPITRKAVTELIKQKQLNGNDYLFGSRIKKEFHISSRQYARIVEF